MSRVDGGGPVKASRVLRQRGHEGSKGLEHQTQTQTRSDVYHVTYITQSCDVYHSVTYITQTHITQTTSDVYLVLGRALAKKFKPLQGDLRGDEKVYSYPLFASIYLLSPDSVEVFVVQGYLAHEKQRPPRTLQ